MIYLDDKTINLIDNYLKSLGSGSKRSPFITEAVENYLKFKKGFGFYKLK